MKIGKCGKKIIKHVSVLAVICIIMAAFSYYTYDELLDREVLQNHFMGTKDGSNKTKKLENGDIISQEFVVSAKGITGIGINIKDLKNSTFVGILKIDILDFETKEVLTSKQLGTYEINNNGYTYFNLDKKIKNKEGKKLLLNIQMEGLQKDSHIVLNLSEKNVYGDEGLYINSELNECDIDLSFIYIPYDTVYKVVILLCILMFFAVPAAYYFLIIKKAKIERVFIVVLFLLELIYMMIIIPNTVPDERTHEYGAYNVSNILLGEKSSENGTLKMRQEDIVENISANNPNRQQYNYFYDNIFKKAEKTQIIEVDKSYYPFYQIDKFLYFISGLGVTIGRVMQLGVIPTLMLGRLFNLLFYCILGYYAIKQMPFGKSVLMVIMLLPISLQQAMSFSYDAIINPMAFTLIALCLKFAYDRENIRRHNYIMYVIFSVLLMQTKGGAYIPLVLLIFLPIMIYRADRLKYPDKKKNGQEQKKLWIALALTVVGFTAYKVIAILVRAAEKTGYGTSGTDGNIEWAGVPAYTIGYLINNPLKVINIIGSTIYEKFDFYLQSFLGEGLGWFKIKVPFVTTIFLIILLLAAVKVAGEKEYFNKKSRLFFLAVGIICFAMCNGGMLLGWTPITQEAIEGVQGRYFIPFALTLLLTIRSNKIVIKQNIDRYLIFFMIALQPFVIYCIEHDAMLV